MRRIQVGIVNYGIGNHSSVRTAIHALDFRCRVSDDVEVLNAVDVLLLPGVGAFPTAMSALAARGMDQYVKEQAAKGRPIVGICLGMQMLTESSTEYGATAGLGLIPGKIVPLGTPRWHIGWNTVKLDRPDPVFDVADGRSFFFNHSYVFQGDESYKVCSTEQQTSIPAVIRKENVFGLQFHPEKSQGDGLILLREMLKALAHVN